MVLVAAACIAHLLAPQSQTVTLVRGGPADGSFRYWAVEDTYIESANPDANYGREVLLVGGPGSTILIRFGDLDRMVPRGMRIARADLILALEIGDPPELQSVGLLRAGWGEGPGRSGRLSSNRPKDPKAQAPTWSATWKHRHAGPRALGWSSPGARESADSQPIPGVTASLEGSAFRIAGLGPTVQWMLEHPVQNRGFAIQLTRPAQFASSDAPSGRPRLVLELEPAPKPEPSADLVVESVTWSYAGPGFPDPGSAVTWRATIRNYGPQPAHGYRTIWSSGERPGAIVQVAKPIAPGEVVTVEFQDKYSGDRKDHRLAPLAFRVECDGPDSSPRNDEVEFDQGAVPLEVWIPESERETIARAAAERGYAGIEDWLQSAVRFWNETMARQSRFSFAMDGCHETVRLASVSYGVDPEPKPPTFGVRWKVSTAYLQEPGGLRAAMRGIAAALGVPDLGAFTQGGATPLPRSLDDPFPGITGGGDTRDECDIPGLFALPYEPWYDPALEFARLEPTDLLAASEVAFLNGRIGKVGDERSLDPFLLPRTCIVRALDPQGRPLAKVGLRFLDPATMDEVLQIETGSGGGVILPNAQAGSGSASALPVPFDGDRRTVLIQASRFGGTAWSAIKLWQFADAFSRGNSGAAVLDVRFNLPAGPIDPTANLALNRIVTDSKQSLPAQLVGVVDGKWESTLSIAANDAGWVEVDLGRDRPIGEVRLDVVGEAYFSAVEVRVYATGQRPSEARLYWKESDGPYALKTRSEPVAGHSDIRSLPMRGAGTVARFVRILFAASPRPVTIAEIRVGLLREE